MYTRNFCGFMNSWATCSLLNVKLLFCGQFWFFHRFITLCFLHLLQFSLKSCYLGRGAEFKKKHINKFTHKVTTPTNYRYNGTSDNRQREERITPKKDKFPSTHCDENHTTPSHFGIKLGLELSLVSVTVSSKWAVVLDPKIISHWVLGNFKIVQMTF